MSNNNDNFVFREQLSDIQNSSVPEPTRDLEYELFGKKGLKSALDNLEQELGYGKSKAVPKFKIYNKVFSANDDEDRELMNDLFNDPKFNIIRWEQTWTVHGDFKVFIIYSENLDLKKTTSAERNENESE